MKSRLISEQQTIEMMIRLYCGGNHGGKTELCDDCESLLLYAIKRLENCPYQEEKDSCNKCQTHCYRADMRGLIKEVMRYSGPRMIAYHPILAINHLLNK